MASTSKSGKSSTSNLTDEMFISEHDKIRVELPECKALRKNKIQEQQRCQKAQKPKEDDRTIEMILKEMTVRIERVEKQNQEIITMLKELKLVMPMVGGKNFGPVKTTELFDPMSMLH